MVVAAELATERALPGATDHGGGIVTFAIYAPEKRSIHLAGNFNNWDWDNDPLADRGSGFWVIQKNLPPGPAQYQFVIDKDIVVCDPYAQALADGPGLQQQPKAIIDVGRPIYQWQHDDFRRAALRDLIVYELHVGDFSEAGTFDGVIKRLDHIRDLGVNAIEFMPLYESRPGDYWGYEPAYYFAVRQSYGRFEDLLRLIDACHARDIAVIIDIVLAHTSHEHPFLRMYQYEQSPWHGQGLGEPNQFGLPILDYSKPATNSFVRDVQAYWLRALHVDGFRYDYLVGIGSDDLGHGLPYLMHTARQINPWAYLIGEAIPEQPGLVNASEIGAVFHTRCRIALECLACERDVIPYNWGDFAETVKPFDFKTQEYRSASFMLNYIESHDDDRLIRDIREAGFDEQTALAKVALGTTALMTCCGEPMLYHGQEFGQDSPKQLGPSRLDWSRLDWPAGQALHEHLRQMIRLRNSRPSLRSDNFEFLLIDADRHCAVWRRWLGELDEVVVFANFSGAQQTAAVNMPQPNQWREYDSGELLDARPLLQIDLPPYSARVFTLGVS